MVANPEPVVTIPDFVTQPPTRSHEASAEATKVKKDNHVCKHINLLYFPLVNSLDLDGEAI